MSSCGVVRAVTRETKSVSAQQTTRVFRTSRSSVRRERPRQDLNLQPSD